MENKTISSKYSFYETPVPSEWKCELFGIKYMILVPEKGKEPNWFWRNMQYLCFGNKWIKPKTGGYKK